MKLKYTLVFSIISFFITTAGFSQELNDREIGFDVTRTTVMLKEHGVKDQDLAREIAMMRVMQAQQYVEIKKIEDGILQKITAEQIAKMNKKHVSNTEKVAFVDIPQTERDALIAFYNSTGGANWTNTIGNNKVWDVTNPSSDVSTWFGVSVTNGHVSQINFYSNNLTGTIPPQIGQLTKLVSLDLNNNKLTGSMPVEIGLLSDLVSLQLSSNFLTGGIPVEIGQLLKLNSLGIRNNTLSNEIPSEIGNLSKLQFIYLDNNQLSGKIPFQIGQLPDLKSLYLYFNQLTGNIPLEVGQLNKLETLMLSYNKLIGSIPAQLGQLISLKSLGLNGNQLSGNIPLEFGQLTNIENISLGYNQYLSGSIPSQLGQLSKLKALSLYSNQLSGPLPIEICQLLNLTSLSLSQNKLSGGIPIQIGKLVNLTELDLQRNQLTGSIPNEIGQLVNITKLHLNNNQLTGTIPPEMGQLSKIAFLILSDNQLTGSIPSELVNLSSMTNFGINNNLLEGKFPDLTLLRSLSNFSFSNNKFRFIDFADHYATFKSKFTTFFEYAPQAKIDSEVTVKAYSGVSVTLTMCTDDRFTNNDTFQWYKGVYPLGKIISGATSRRFLISNPATLDAGDYYCLSKNPQITDPSVNGYYGANRNLILERNPIHLEVINCTPVTGTLKASAESPAVSASTVFSLETTATGLTYKWTFYNDASGTTVKDDAQTTAVASQSYSVAGSYLARLEVTEANGCTTKFDKVVNVINNCVDSYSPNRNGSINTPYPYGDISGVVLNKVTNLSFYSSSGNTSLSYQWNLFDFNNLLVASGNQVIFPITVTIAGDYKVTLRVTDAMGCSSFERDLKTREATPCIVPISDRDGYIRNPTNSEKLLVNTATVLSLNRGSSYTTTGFTYKWDLVKLNGGIVFSGNEENFAVTPTEIGDYTINLEIKDPNGCTTNYIRDYKVVDICVFTENEVGWIGASEEYNGSATYFVKINESKDFNLTFGGQDFSANLTYKWRLLNPSGELILTGTNATFSSVFTIPGYYRVELETTNTITGCKINYTKEVGCLIGNSCTELNPKSAEVKTLLNNLIKSLLIRSIKGETDTQINTSPTSPEFLALKPYITKVIGDNIYNYNYSKNIGNSARPYSETIDFSFSSDRLSDIHLDFYWGISGYANLTDEEILNRLDYDIFIDLSQYISANDYFISCRVDNGGKNATAAVSPKECRQESEVRYIDFCPTDCTPIDGILKSTPQVLNANVNASFSLETAATNVTYDWIFYNLDNTTELARATTAIPTQSFTAAGRYRIILNVKDDKGCVTPFETFTTVLPACTPITGVIKIGSGATPTPSPNPTPIPTKSYWYQAVHPLGHSGTDYVIYIDGNGVKQTYTLTRTESGYNAPCVEIIASSIFNHSGATPCVSE